MCSPTSNNRKTLPKIIHHLYLLCQQRWFEVRLDHHLNLQLGAAHLPDQRDDAEGQDDVFGGAVSESQTLQSILCVKRSNTRLHNLYQLTSWAHNLHREEWSWCCAPSQTCWAGRTGGTCSHRSQWTVCRCCSGHRREDTWMKPQRNHENTHTRGLDSMTGEWDLG